MKLAAITTDNGANVKCAVMLLEWDHVRCFSHTLQLAVDKVLHQPDVSKALAWCRHLVSHFNQSSKSSYILKEKQADLKYKELALIQSVATRWNSSYYMVERIISQQQPLCVALLELRKGDLMPSDDEIKTLESFLEVMKPLVMMTEAIGGVTITSVRPLIYNLFTVYLMPDEGENRVKRSMRTVMRDKLSDCYGTDDDLALLNKATALDPQFKNAPFVSTDGLVEEMAAVIEENSPPSDIESTSPDPKRPKSMLMKLIGDVIPTPLQQVDDPIDKAKQELQRYLVDLINVDDDLDPLTWWAGNINRYPTLAILARKYLSVCATSRAFSLAGHIVNERRASLLPETVNMLSFLSDNLP